LDDSRCGTCAAGNAAPRRNTATPSPDPETALGSAAMLEFVPTRAAGLARLAAFLPRAGRDYAALRNHDDAAKSHVSTLSPWLRHRLIGEQEVIAAAAHTHGNAAEKFVSEVLWRTYWKGWLELRPQVWTAYRAGLARALDRLAVESGLRADWEAACTGRTGIDGFDDWARELADTGYLHNHARMWFASIWIFTLRLPWELGADFFLRYLLDGDPASNTLSWRWVGGLHTPGKTYLATADNIARHTGGRFRPQGLAREALPLPGPPNPPPMAPPQGDRPDPQAATALILHEDDLDPDLPLTSGPRPVATALLTLPQGRSPLAPHPRIAAWATEAAAGVAAEAGDRLGAVTPVTDPASLADWASATGAAQVVMPWAPAGPVADALADLAPRLAARGQRLVRLLRPWDATHWPHATRGFFAFHQAVRR
jgi:deoxyribodipyrimidine photo-lyase